MDEYKQLNWSKHNPRSEAKLLEQSAIDFALYQDDIFNLHINEIDPIHRLEDTFSNFTDAIELPVDPRTGETVHELEVEVSKPLRLFGQFPSGSRLQADEHQHCLTVLNRLNMRLPFVSPEDTKAYKRYLKIMKKLAPERELFDSFVRNYFFTNLLHRVKHIEPALDELVVKTWQRKIEERVSDPSGFGGNYRLMTAVAFGGYQESGASGVTLEPVEREVLETGHVRKFFTESLLHGATLRRSQRILDTFLDEWCSVQRRCKEETNEVLSLLHQLPEVSIVIPAGTLTLLLNHFRNAQEQWTIPFRIKHVHGRQVMLIESKLPATKLSTHARKVKAHKLLVKTFMKFPINKANLDSANQLNMVSDERKEMQFEPVTFDQYMGRIVSKTTSKRQQLRDHRCYQPWKLKDGEHEHFLLTVSRQDCFESFRKERIFMNISVKLEYQPEFGAEQMSKVELMQEWGRQLLRPSSKTLRLRVNAMTRAIISHHYLELRDIEEELARLYGIQPKHLLANVWSTLKLLQTFPCGDYLLKRGEKSMQGLSVYARDDGKTAAGVALVDFCKLVRTVEYESPPLEQYEWVPIDKFIITKLHRENILLPCSFPHWKLVRRLESRECHKPKQKAAQKAAPVVKQGGGGQKPENAAPKPPSRGKLLRKEKLKKRKQELRQQKALAEKIRQSLDQYAPYEGPSGMASHRQPIVGPGPQVQKDGHGGESAGSKQVISLKRSITSESVDYGAYAQQALADPSETQRQIQGNVPSKEAHAVHATTPN